MEIYFVARMYNLFCSLLVTELQGDMKLIDHNKTTQRCVSKSCIQSEQHFSAPDGSGEKALRINDGPNR